MEHFIRVFLQSFVFCFILYLIPGSVQLSNASSLALSSDNFDQNIANNELVFINFYADWCRFSQILAPVFDEAAVKVANEVAAPNKVLFGKVDCDKETSIAQRFHITKYPTLKVIQHGKVMKKEYRGQRSVEALTSHVKDLLKDNVIEVTGDELDKIGEKKAAVVAYLQKKDSQHYDTLRKIAMDLREDCYFYVKFGGEVPGQDPVTSNYIIVKPVRAKIGENDEKYTGDMLSYDELSVWATNKCIPTVREITFENAEELTEEGLPFLILFYNPKDKSSIDAFIHEVNTQLKDDLKNINCLIADGVKFSHPLHHLGKGESDLPLIAIDSFRHMYIFPKFEQLSTPGKLKKFVEDLYSGKLHREFHYGPEEVEQTDDSQDDQQNQDYQTDPPESTFRKLGPSRNRYTLLRDEL